MSLASQFTALAKGLSVQKVAPGDLYMASQHVQDVSSVA